MNKITAILNKYGILRPNWQKIGIEMVRVPAGEFLMGSDKRKDPDAWNEERPQHKVTLGEYWIGKYPVTNAQFAAFVTATGHRAPGHWAESQPPADKLKHPVVQVSWDDATAFCQWAGCRLPTEAQWEKAARGTDGRIYPWGDAAPDKTRCNYGLNVNDTTPVGQYSPAGDSPFGCADMAGNVWEWCADWHDEEYYASSPAREPTGPASGGHRVRRGGSYFDKAWIARSAFRYFYRPYYRHINIGFRVSVATGSP